MTEGIPPSFAKEIGLLVIHFVKRFFEQSFSLDLLTTFSTFGPEIVESHVLSLNTPNQWRRTMRAPEKWQRPREHLPAPLHCLERVPALSLLRVKNHSVLQKFLPDFVLKHRERFLFEMLDQKPLN